LTWIYWKAGTSGQNPSWARRCALINVNGCQE